MSGQLTDRCATCGHERQQHIYNEGACRPGWVCHKACEQFVDPNPKERVEEILLDKDDGDCTLLCGCIYERTEDDAFMVTWCERHGEMRR